MAKIAAMKSPPLPGSNGVAICLRQMTFGGIEVSFGLGTSVNSRAAEKLSVAFSHQGDSALHQADGAIAQGRSLPRLPLKPTCTKQHFGNFSIRGSVEMTVESTEHENEAVPPLVCQ
jgi:hypothetical protein